MDRYLTRKRSLLGLALLLVVAALAALLLRPRANAPVLARPRTESLAASLSEAFPVGRRPIAARLHGRMLQGSQRDLAFAGHVTVINFWASWCAPCRREARALARYAETPGNPPLVGIDTNDTRTDALAFIRRYRSRFPNLSDPEGSFSRDYHAPGLPTTIVVDSQGRIAELLAGPQTLRSLALAARRTVSER